MDKRDWPPFIALPFPPPLGIKSTRLPDWKPQRKLIASGIGLACFWVLTVGCSGSRSTLDGSSPEQTQPSQSVLEAVPAQENTTKTDDSKIYTLTRIIDGDTFEAFQDGETIKVRLACIDAPETDQMPFGPAARDRLSSLVPGQVRLNIVDVDRDGRSVAEVFTPDDTFVNQMLLESGDAVVYPQYLSNCGENADRLLSAEALAKSEDRGVWADASFVMPWDYRKGERAAAPESPPDTVAASPAPAPTSNLPACINGDCNCSDFSSWQQAQDVLNAYPGDPHRLDRDNDGIVCESLR